MQCSSLPTQQRGRIGFLALGSLVVIAGMYLALAKPGNAPQAAMVASIEQAPSAALTKLSSTQDKVEEVIVTAPRIEPTVVEIDAPTLNVAVSSPSAPRSFWQSQS